jgi:hypothetical protein
MVVLGRFPVNCIEDWRFAFDAKASQGVSPLKSPRAIFLRNSRAALEDLGVRSQNRNFRIKESRIGISLFSSTNPITFPNWEL